MPRKWDFYFARVNDAAASIFVNLALLGSIPDTKRPYLLYIWLYFQQPRDDGLSSRTEASTLFKIENAMTRAATRSSDAQFVGRITTQGRRELYFYGKSTGHFQDSIASVMRRFPKYKFDTGYQRDREWSHYVNVLYPSPISIQWMKDRDTVDVLESHGDSLRSSRPVRHWAYFKAANKRAAFIRKAIALGYKLIDQSTCTNAGDNCPFGVILERKDRVDLDSINSISVRLLKLSQSLGGSYDGWETQLVKSKRR